MFVLLTWLFSKTSILIGLAFIPRPTSGKRRLITDLSFPHGKSVTNGIPVESCHISCPGIQQGINKVIKYGPGALMVTIDLERAYHSFQVRGSDRYLLGMFRKNKYYVDLPLPFGLCNPRIFLSVVQTFGRMGFFGQPEHIIDNDLQHYYDDF